MLSTVRFCGRTLLSNLASDSNEAESGFECEETDQGWSLLDNVVPTAASNGVIEEREIPSLRGKRERQRSRRMSETAIQSASLPNHFCSYIRNYEDILVTLT